MTRRAWRITDLTAVAWIDACASARRAVLSISKRIVRFSGPINLNSSTAEALPSFSADDSGGRGPTWRAEEGEWCTRTFDSAGSRVGRQSTRRSCSASLDTSDMPWKVISLPAREGRR